MRRVLLALGTGALVLAPSAAWAEAPQKSAWFNAVTVGPITAPAPTLAEGDLRVAGTGERPTAYATLQLSSPGTSGGELVLAVRPDSSAGTVELAACPTKTATWEAGGNQPFPEGPGYDCAAGVVFGALSADGTSVSFPLDSTVQSSPGTISLAIAPLPESTAPFTIDLGDPEYTPAGEESPAQEPAAPAAEEPAAPGGEGVAEAPPLSPGSDPGAAPEEPAAVDDAPAPELAGVEAPPLAPEQAPADAAAAPAPETAELPAAPAAVLPGAQLAAQRTGTDGGDGPRLLALLTLVAVSAGAGYAAGQQRPAPRLLGGRSRAALPAGGTPGAVPALVEPAGQDVLPRGIGRFSRVRDAAPRRLR